MGTKYTGCCERFAAVDTFIGPLPTVYLGVGGKWQVSSGKLSVVPDIIHFVSDIFQLI